MVKRLINSKTYELPIKLHTILNKYKYVFNPSFLIYNEYNYLAIRVFDNSSNTILALLFVWGEKQNIKSINLSEYFFLKLGIIKVADPKLFIMDNLVCGTFNTGDRMKSSNQIMLFEMDANSIINFYNCNYSERTRIEKNWAFFKIDNEIRVLYSLNPLIILKSVEKKDNCIEFKEEYRDENLKFNNYSIGTSLLELNDKYCFIAHKKYFFNRKRLYLGRLFELSKENKAKIKAKPLILFHSFRSLFGDNHKFNKNLISCTYFSGIYKCNDEIILSYGINDVKWKLAIMKVKQLWR